MFEMSQRFGGMLDIGVRHRLVLAHDLHALDLVAMHRVHNLDDGQPVLSSSGVCHRVSNLARTSGLATDW